MMKKQIISDFEKKIVKGAILALVISMIGQYIYYIPADPLVNADNPYDWNFESNLALSIQMEERSISLLNLESWAITDIDPQLDYEESILRRDHSLTGMGIPIFSHQVYSMMIAKIYEEKAISNIYWPQVDLGYMPYIGLMEEAILRVTKWYDIQSSMVTNLSRAFSRDLRLLENVSYLEDPTTVNDIWWENVYTADVIWFAHQIFDDGTYLDIRVFDNYAVIAQKKLVYYEWIDDGEKGFGLDGIIYAAMTGDFPDIVFPNYTQEVNNFIEVGIIA
jgi:hypothetical protein